jgi:pilus assembly protein CpaC
MAPMPPFGHTRNRLSIPGRPFLAALVVFAAMPSRSNAQPPAMAGAVPLDLAAPSLNDRQDLTDLTAVPLAKPRPTEGPSSVDSFVDGLHGSDAAIKVLVNQARILTLKQDITAGPNRPLIAVGDPTILDFTVVNSKQIRLIGKGVGVTDLAITTGGNETYTFEIRVLADLSLIQDKLRATFPDASVKLSQIRDHFVVEGEARDQAQIFRIIQTINAYLVSVYIEQGRTVTVGQTRQVLGALGGQLPGFAGPAGAAGALGAPPGFVLPMQPGAAGAQGVVPGAAIQPGAEGEAPVNPFAAYAASSELAGPTQISNRGAQPQIINLLRVPTSQQVMLKVRIAELNRTSLRQIGSNFLGVDPKNGAIVGSSIAGNTGFQGQIGQTGNLVAGNNLFGSATLGPAGTGQTSVFGIFQAANFEFMLNALRTNGLLKILAEPNLVALNGQLASFLAGGEFPVPVPQVSAQGVAPTITVRFREFGVRLGFVPYVLDGNVIRLTVAPEVSNIDFTIAVTLVAGGSPVPGLNTRKAQTTVEMREGQTLAIAGLLQLTLNGNTNRIPGLGDLPILGPFFSNTTSQRIEKELVVLVTPYLVEPMLKEQVPPGPGDEVKAPNDLEVFFLNRIEGRTGKDFRATTNWDDPWNLRYHLNLEKKYVQGPVGYSE